MYFLPTDALQYRAKLSCTVMKALLGSSRIYVFMVVYILYY
jgi:hypothetical protein